MAKNDYNQNDDNLDPEIADLMNIKSAGPSSDTPSFQTLFGEEKDTDTPDTPDISKKTFPEVPEIEEEAKPYFTDKHFYQKILKGEGQASKRLHNLLSKFLTAEDNQDRSVFRQKLVPAFWEVASNIAAKIYKKNLPIQKQLLIRFGVLLPSLLTKDQRQMITKVIFEDRYGEPIYYTDEWLKLIAAGKVHPSAQDEVKTSVKNKGMRTKKQADKARGQRDTAKGLVQSKLMKREDLERELIESVKALAAHNTHSRFPELKAPYTDAQKKSLSNLQQSAKELLSVDREINSAFDDLEKAEENLQDLENQMEDEEFENVDNETITNEFNTLRQMIKLTVGRQGNHFPFLMKNYFRANIRDIGIRENIIKLMAEVEGLDPEIFMRSFKGATNRIVPNTLLVPCYGDTGICWEPFERYNRATSRGRIVIPMYPKDLKLAVLSALADLRWQVAKEKAQHYWMEEGITGKYYQWFSDNKMKGDVREAFIQDYILWITKECEGTQKLEREVRGIFWRNMPFPQDIKDKLKNRGYVYNELYKKDSNRALSDGY
ncbi:MAG: hypothetical protein ACLFR1_14740 [Spirochaetia bacterium]